MLDFNDIILFLAFILHRGRAQLMLDTEVVRCKLVSFQTPPFLEQYKVLELMSFFQVNHIGNFKIDPLYHRLLLFS